MASDLVSRGTAPNIVKCRKVVSVSPELKGRASALNEVSSYLGVTIPSYESLGPYESRYLGQCRDYAPLPLFLSSSKYTSQTMLETVKGAPSIIVNVRRQMALKLDPEFVLGSCSNRPTDAILCTKKSEPRLIRKQRVGIDRDAVLEHVSPIIPIPASN